MKVTKFQGGWTEQAMRTLTVMVLALATLALPASAQMNGKRPNGDDQKSAKKGPVVDEKAYKAALEKIPEPKEKYDPWGIARPESAKKK